MAIFVLCVIAATAFAPGYLFLVDAESRGLPAIINDKTIIPFSFGLSVILIAAIQFVIFIIGAPRYSALVVYLAAILALVWRADLKNRLNFTVMPVLSAFFLYLLYLLALLALTPRYGAAFNGDWTLYFPNALIYAGLINPKAVHGGLSLDFLIRRTPLMSLFAAFYMSLFGPVFACFQLACVFANSLIFLVVLLLSESAFGRRASFFALLAAMISPALIREILAPEPKILGAFFTLVAVSCYWAERQRPLGKASCGTGILTGPFTVAAFMAHPSMLFYVIWIYADELFRRITQRRPLNPALWFSTIAAWLILAAPWYAWTSHAFGWRTAFTPSATISKPLHFSIAGYFYARITMIIATIFVPLHLALGIMQKHLPPATLLFPGNSGSNSPGHWNRWVLRFYEQTFLGGATIAAGLCAFWAALIKKRRSSLRNAPVSLVFWMGLGALTCVLVHVGITDNKGQATNLMAPLFVLWICWVGKSLADSKLGVAVSILVIAAAEFSYSRILAFFLTRAVPAGRYIDLYDFSLSWLRHRHLSFAIPILAAAAAAALSARLQWIFTLGGNGFQKTR
ncbi:MAG: hypothetical protein ACYCPQ_01905 [Elusimicrobiota bacterium]